MKGKTRGRRSVPRLLGVMLTVALYLAVLVAATQVTGSTGPPRSAQPAAAVQAVEAASASAAEEAPTIAESPALTMAIAALGIAVAGAWRLARVARRPRPVPVTSTRRGIPTTG
jgi:hypothetical protein